MSDIEQIELSIEDAKELIKRKDMALKLASNREFKKLVLDGYFVDEAARLVAVSGDYLQKDYRDEIFDAIKAISHFKQFMQNIVKTGEIAERELRDQEEVLDELRAADLNTSEEYH